MSEPTRVKRHNKKMTGESFAAKQNTHRPSPTRADGLHARDKGPRYHTASQKAKQDRRYES